MTELPADEAVVLTVLDDAAGARLDLAAVAAGTAWPGERTFGLRRTRQALEGLVARGELASSTDGTWRSRSTRSTP